MRFDFLILPALLGGFVAILMMVAADLRRRRELADERLRVLRDALQRPDLDAELRREITRLIAGDQARQGVTAGVWLQRIAFGVGWLLFFFGSGICLLAWLDLVDGVRISTFSTAALAGLGLMTLPTALREMVRREQQAPNHR